MLDDLFMGFLKDKGKALKSVLEDIQSTMKYSDGMSKFLGTIDTCDLEEADIRKKLKTMMKVLDKQNAIIRKMLLINLVYMQGRNFGSDAGSALVKMGRGEEALRAMFESKMRGTS
ncbi:MAG TPA: hypothetical protein DHV36_09540 [Desulfobacteraceae bacterium]|nr:hypothetical protein [Desulfobacteraceae bacterium]|tara:strand:- start:167 stop:514 length:348 start_codon:yes stop_codon:yes gene_type:complete